MRISLCKIGIAFLLLGCSINPQNADFGLDITLPETKVTIYQQAINQLGLMTTIYSSLPMKVQVRSIYDNTGTSIPTNAEIPRDITEMVKSTLNAIGGNVMYIPFDPEFMLQSAQTGYSDFGDKILPQIVLTGGITEFDRGLVTKGDTLEADVSIMKKWGGFNAQDELKASLSSVTLDFNLFEFQRMIGIPRMQAVNGIKLHKGTRSDSLGFTIKSATFGAKGEITKVQGRHAAVRMLVQLCMIQVVGRYMKLPYWRLVPAAERDEVVIDQVLGDYYAMTQEQQIYKTQELLYLHGYTVAPTGKIDSLTRSALKDFASKQNLNSEILDQNTYLALYENVPITAATRQLRKNLDNPASLLATVQNNSIPVPSPESASSKYTEEIENVSQSDEHLSLSINKTEFKIGEKLEIQFSVESPMHVWIVLIDSAGQSTTLFPNVYQQDNYCFPGKIYTIPPKENSSFSLDIGEPVGIDKIRAVGSKTQIPLEKIRFTANGEFDETTMAAYKIRSAIDFKVTR